MENILTTKVGDELVVFNTATNAASCLDKFTASVWLACDGKNSVPTLLDTLNHAGFSDAGDVAIWMVINQLKQAGLLEEEIDIPARKQLHMSRREMLRKLGAGTASALPIVSTINIQPAVAQSSACQPRFGPCGSDSDCCSGNCNTIQGLCVGN